MELVEREAAVVVCRDALADARAGHGSVLVVVGEAGMGKTALVEAAFLQRDDVHVHIGACDDLSIPRPLGPFRDVVDSGPAVLGDALAAGVERLRRALSTLLDSPPATVLVVEDVHWADEATLDLLAYLARRVVGGRGVLVLTTRPTRPGGTAVPDAVARVIAHAPRRALRRVQLASLTPEAVARMAEGNERDAATLYIDSGGNPLFVTELLASEDRVPGSVQAQIVHRLDGLDDGARRLARSLSSAPGTVPWEVVEQLDDAWQHSVAALEGAGLLVGSTAGVEFRHQLCRVALESTLTEAERRAAGLQVLQALTATGGDPALVAHVASTVGDLDTLLVAAVEAADAAGSMGAHGEAVRHLERALPHAARLEARSRAELFAAAAREYSFTEQIDESVRHGDEAVRLWRAVGGAAELVDALERQSAMVHLLGDVEASNRLLDEAVATAARWLDPVDRARLEIVEGEQLGLTSSRWHDALVWADRSVATATAIGDQEVLGLALSARETARRLVGGDGAARADGDRAAEILAASGSHEALLTVACSRVTVDVLTFAMDEVDSDLKTARTYVAAHDDGSFSLWLDKAESRLALDRGDVDHAVALAEDALDRTPPSTRRAMPLAVLALAAARRGDLSAAMRLQSECDELLAGLRDLRRLGWSAVGAAELAWLGAPLDAERFLSVARLAARSGLRRFAAELGVWCDRLELPRQGSHLDQDAPAPLVAELGGDHQGAAAAWRSLGCEPAAATALAFGGPQSGLEALRSPHAVWAPAFAARVRADLRAVGITPPRPRRRSTVANPAGLTARQVDVVRLVAEGLTNDEIADRLFISPKTVDHHVSAILRTLEVPDRRAAAARATELGVVDGPA